MGRVSSWNKLVARWLNGFHLFSTARASWLSDVTEVSSGEFWLWIVSELACENSEYNFNVPWPDTETELLWDQYEEDYVLSEEYEDSSDSEELWEHSSMVEQFCYKE